MLSSPKAFVRKAIRILGYDIVQCNEDAKNRIEKDFNVTISDLLIQKAVVLSEGQIGLVEAAFLSHLVENLPCEGPIVEIGTLFGWSTRIIAIRKSPHRELITVDDYSWNPFGISPEMHFRITREALTEAMAKLNVRLVRASKRAFYSSYDGKPPSLVFLDADHTYEATKEDLFWAREVKAHTICGHDYDPIRHPGVVHAVDELGGPRKVVDTLWLL